ncbi:zinc finger and BTB domain-containing protein 12 [Bombina bombina]|uniref:zinc finger and BTB domain-containing protein 12 n=1 Tax=Bombina bombina TaxID=8345 RepID=UPI00235AF0FF|nr:zinc finger and BTB domain-containing protein 12 [Bombina bombina]
MASATDLLRFQLPGHEAATLRSMNQLRSEERFCDVTVLSDGLKFRGHRVVLAACSPFLRDQFLLNPSSELQVSLMHGPKVVTDLLLSCYTGLLEFSIRDIVNYLTAASYLQMEHVVEKCRQALSQFIEPKIGLRDLNKVMGSRGSPTSTSLRQMRPSESWRSLKSEPKAEEESEEEMLMMAEEEEDDDDDEEEEGTSSDVCIVKVETGMSGGVVKNGCSWGKGGEEKSSMAQPEEALVNSTVEGGEINEGGIQHGGVMKAIYSEEVEGGEGVLIIPSSYHEEEDEEVLDGGNRCQSTMTVSGMSRNIISGIGGIGATEAAMLIGDGRSGNRKSVRCSKCEEVFQGVEKLVFHMRAQHFVFMCPRCGKQFNHSSNLNRHMNVHRGVKSHSCQVCGKSFTQKSTLHDHLNLHSGERPYRCSYCDVRFAHKPAIRRHLKEQHGKTTAENVIQASVAEINVVVG